MTRWQLHEGEEIASGLSAVRVIGGGRRYEAYLAWQDHRRALVVAKVVRPHLTSDAGTLAGLHGEARALARLSHPLLPRSYGGVLDGARPHLVLGHIEGPRLSTVLRRFGTAIEQLLPLALNLCSVLHYLAQERVVHLDVKPSNVIMAADPRLIDLSIARPVDELESLSHPVGTDAYMAPEQCQPERFGLLGPATDVWGLGATLYEALAGRPPFAPGEDRFPQLTHRPAPLAVPHDLGLGALVMACLTPNPDARPTPAQLAERLEPLVAALPVARLGRLKPSPRALATENANRQEVHA